MAKGQQKEAWEERIYLSIYTVFKHLILWGFFYFGSVADRVAGTRPQDIQAPSLAVLVLREFNHGASFNAKHILPPSQEFRVRNPLPFLSLDVIFHLPVFSLYMSATLSFRPWSTVTMTAGAAPDSTALCVDYAQLSDYSGYISAYPTLCTTDGPRHHSTVILQQIRALNFFFFMRSA